MKIVNILALAVSLSLVTSAISETMHQKVDGDSAFTGDGRKAIDKKLIETKDLPAVGDGKVARMKADFPQWGFVAYWFGVPAPAGKVILRFRVYVDGTETATYAVYVHESSTQTYLSKLEIPADAKKDSFVKIDLPVDQPGEWNAVTLKKMDSAPKPGPWINTISVVLP